MKLFTILLLGGWLLPQWLPAKDTPFKTLDNVAALQQKLSQNAARTKTILSDFVQEKHMKMLQDKTVSKGKFYFKQQDKIRIEYTSPFEYLIVMSGGNITIKDHGSVNRVNAQNSRTMQSVNQVLMDCVKGTVFDNKDFSVAALESPEAYKMILTPRQKELSQLFSHIVVVIRKSDLTVARLVMKQPNGDRTEMKFMHTKTNVPLKDALFFIH